MRRKNKLVFAELEHELSIIPHYQMLIILGGGNVNTIEQAVQWAQSMGIPFTVDGQNQYKDSGGNILLSPVDVYAWANDFQNPNPNPYSTTTVPEIMPTEMEIKRSYALYFESLGYEMIQNEDGTYYCASRPYPTPHDPWKRVNGELVSTRTQQPAFNYDRYVDMTMEEYNITTVKNETMSLYKVTSVIDPVTGLSRAPTVAESGNCLGYALTGQTGYWVLDNPNTPINQSDEGRITDTFLKLKLGYEVTTNKYEATLVIVYNGAEAIHAGIVGPGGTYSAKGGTDPVVTGMTSEAEFLQPYGPTKANYFEGTVVYYK